MRKPSMANGLRSFLIFPLGLFLAVTMAPAAAETWLKGPNSTSVVREYRLTTVPGDGILIWDNEAAAGNYSSSGTSLLCGALLQNGMCAMSRTVTPNVPSTQPWSSPVTLRFVERRTKVPIDLVLAGHGRTKRDAGGQTAYIQLNEAWPGNLREMHDVGAGEAGGSRRYPGELSYSLRIASDQLARIPFGGVWEAQLRMTLHNGAPEAGSLETAWNYPWSADITLRVVDERRIHLYTEGSVTMPLHLSGNMLSGEAFIEACLYDGYGANAPQYQLTLRDPQSEGPDFAIRHDNPAAPRDSGVIDYQVSISKPGKGGIPSTRVRSGEGTVYAGMDKALVGATPSSEAACLPWYIRLDAPPFDSLTKQAGDYRGVLQIEFTPRID